MITAVIDAGQHYCQAVSDLWQWDYGQTLRIQGVKLPAAVEVQFSTTERIGETVTRIGVTKEGVTEVPVPDVLLEGSGTTQDYTIYAFVYIENGDSGKTEYRVSMKVRARPKPEAHAAPEEGELFRQAIVAVAESADRAESARKSAEASADEAKTSKENAETAVKNAEAFKTEAETARSEAVRAATESTDAKNSAEKSRAAAEKAKQDAEEAKAAADADKEAAETAQAKAEAAQKAAENAETEAKKAQTATETAKRETETAKNDAVQAKEAAERAKIGTAADREVTEAASKAAQVSAVSAEKSAERAETAKEEIQESADQIQKNAIEIDSLKENKITKPAEAPTIGKIIRVKSVNEDGTFICEWADGASDLDVQINGESIVQNGIAEIPITQKNKQYGLFCILNNYNLLGFSNDNNLPIIKIATERNISNRDNINSLGVGGVIDSCNFDKTVKAAMCDGKGTAWTAEEQAAARERMGIYDWEDILDVTLEEDGAVNLDLNGTFKDLYLYINQSNVKTPITGNTFLIPYCANDSGYFNAYYPPTTTAFKDIAAIWYYNENITYRYACVSNAQKESTGTQTAYLKVWDKNNRTDSKIYPSGAFIGLNGLTVWKAKTRIVVKGVRA